MRRQCKDARLAEQASATIIGVFDTAELLTGHALDAIMLSEGLVEVRVVRVEEIEHALVLPHEVHEELLCLLTHVVRELFVEIRILERVRVHLLDILKAQPLRGETRREGVGAVISQHPVRLLAEHGGVVQRAALAECDERRIRRRAPKEEGQTGREIESVDRNAIARLRLWRKSLEPENEMRAGQN